MAQHSLYDNANAAADFIRRTGVEISAKGVNLANVVPIDYPEKIREIGGGSAADIDVWNDSGVYTYFYIDFKQSVQNFSVGMARESIELYYNKVSITMTAVERVNDTTYKIYCNLDSRPNGISVVNQKNSLIHYANGSTVQGFSAHFYVSGQPSNMRLGYAYDEAEFIKMALTAADTAVFESYGMKDFAAYDEGTLIKPKPFTAYDSCEIIYY